MDYSSVPYVIEKTGMVITILALIVAKKISNDFRFLAVI